MEDSHQEEEVKTTPPTGDDSADDFDFESLFADESDPEAEKEKFLAQINKVEGRNYKTIEDWSKTNRERKKIADKIYSEQGRKKEEEKKPETTQPSNTNVRYAEKLLTIENPEAKHALEDIRQVAKDTGLDPLEVWDKFSWIRKEAKARAEEAEEKEKNGKKVSSPSRKVSGTGGGGELSDADRALLARKPGLLEKYNKEHNK